MQRHGGALVETMVYIGQTIPEAEMLKQFISNSLNYLQYPSIRSYGPSFLTVASNSHNNYPYTSLEGITFKSAIQLPRFSPSHHSCNIIRPS